MNLIVTSWLFSEISLLIFVRHEPLIITHVNQILQVNIQLLILFEVIVM